MTRKRCLWKKYRASPDNENMLLNCVVDDGIIPKTPNVAPNNASLDRIDLNPSSVLRALKKVKSHESSGPDGFPPLLFHKLANCFSNPLSIIYTSIMYVGNVPNVWRSAYVTPVYKSWLWSSVANARFISLTCVGSKVMERVISCTVLAYLRERGMIIKQQHSFLSQKSTCLWESLNDWPLAIKRKRYVGVYRFRQSF